MTRFYARQFSSDGIPLVAMRTPNGDKVLIEISVELSKALDDMQREAWRIDRREARHTLSLDAMFPCVAIADEGVNPETVLVRRCDSKRLLRALASLPATQLRRLLLYAIAQVPVKDIAFHEGCSERAVKYSLAKAREKMKKFLSGDFT